MELKEVKGSSQVTAFGYDKDSKVLHVRFTNGAEYTYHGVGHELHQKMGEAESLGKFLHKHIKGKYPHKMVKEPKKKDAT